MLQGLRVTSRPGKGEIQLHIGNENSVGLEAVGTLYLRLPNGCDLVLNDCYNVPGLVRQIVSLSVFDREGYHINIRNCSLYLYNDKK